MRAHGKDAFAINRNESSLLDDTDRVVNHLFGVDRDVLAKNAAWLVHTVQHAVEVVSLEVYVHTTLS
jgi:hypothetical protein